MFGWEPWKDVMVFNFVESYLLQGRKHKRTRATQFRVVKPRMWTGQCASLTQEKLEAAGLWESAAKKEG